MAGSSNVNFYLHFNLVLYRSEGVPGIAPFYISTIMKEIIQPAAVINGIQGIVTYTQTPVSSNDAAEVISSAATYNILVTFPATVQALFTSQTCPPTTTPIFTTVDLTWARSNVPTWLLSFNASLELGGDLYVDTLTYVTDVLGTTPFFLDYTPATWQLPSTACPLTAALF